MPMPTAGTAWQIHWLHFHRFTFAKQSILLHVSESPHSPKTHHGEILHPLPSPPPPHNNAQGNVIQNKTCHLPTSRGRAANTLDQFSSPVMLQPPTLQYSPGIRAVMHSGAGRAGQGCSPSCCFKPEGKWTGKRPREKAW